ncbi:MAG TPA: hypothetical protein VG796_27365 [Verrucomicrobiales bacterium]|jgi:hypothetical protein|nr:hypothetical protein [Verrucomicrobiales bacterium]
MSTPSPLRPLGTCLLITVLFAGPTACSPSVTDIELSSSKTRAEDAQKEQYAEEKELKTLNEEYRALRDGFTGPQHADKAKKAESLRQEKAELESIKADVDSKVAHFVSEAKRHRDELAKEKP